MQAAFRLARAICRGLAFLGAAAVVLMMLHISLDVVLRGLFRMSINITSEMVARYYMVALAFLPLGWIELRRDMVSVELIEFALNPAMLRLSDILVGLISAVIYGALAWVTWAEAFENFAKGSFVEFLRWNMPIWQSYFLPPLGFTVACLATLMVTLGRLSPALDAGADAA